MDRFKLDQSQQSQPSTDDEQHDQHVLMLQNAPLADRNAALQSLPRIRTNASGPHSTPQVSPSPFKYLPAVIVLDHRVGLDLSPAFHIPAQEVDMTSLIADLRGTESAEHRVWDSTTLVLVNGNKNDLAFLAREMEILEQTAVILHDGSPSVERLVVVLRALASETPGSALDRASDLQTAAVEKIASAFKAAKGPNAVVAHLALPAVIAPVRISAIPARRQRRAIDPSCPATVAECQQRFANCSSHGACVSQPNRKVPGTSCFRCSCTLKKWTDDAGKPVKGYDGPVTWVGDACQFQDVSASFQILFWFAVGSVVLLFSMSREFYLSHARVALDIDFGNKSLQGIVEFTITPLAAALAELKFHSRQCDILKVSVNGVEAKFTLADPMDQQAKLAQQGIFYDLPERTIDASRRADDDAGELTVFVPQGVECEPISGASLFTSSADEQAAGVGMAGMAPAENAANAATAATTATTAAAPAKPQPDQPPQDATGEIAYRNWTVAIEYAVIKPDIAITFAGLEGTSSLSHKLPHVFLHNPLNQARWWMPCIDKSHDRMTFDFEITIPRTLGHVRRTLAHPAGTRVPDSDDDLRMVAVCSGELVEYFVHPEDPSKTVWVYAVQTPLNASSVLLAAGPFEVLSIQGWGRSVAASMRNAEPMLPDEEPFETGVQRSGGKGLVFVLPGYKRDALEFFEQWVGASFPFSSFKLVFVEECIAPVVTGATVVLTRTDVWVIVGFVNWMAALLMRKMFGVNEFKYRLRKDTERVCILDVNQPPLCPDVETLGSIGDDGAPYAASISSMMIQSYSPNDDPASARAELVMLKSPLVLNMLEKRMGKGLLQKLANKLMISAMSGELPTGLSTTSFLKMVRKTSGRLEIKEFAEQWIYRSGCPIFTIRYHFNRKKMVIELKIKQDCTNEGMVGGTSIFSGPFTVRVQEPGGTFDTELQQLQQQQQLSAELQIAEPDRITFEWIRLDPDAIWVCTKTFEQEDFMWHALLRKEKDINAQCEAIEAISKIQTLASLNTLTAFARDPLQFYRLRILCVLSIANFDSEELEAAALSNLVKMYQDLFCMPDEPSIVPKRNNFAVLQEYHLQRAIIQSLSRLFVDLLRLNDNSGNDYADGEWVATLVKYVGESFIVRKKDKTSGAGRSASRSVFLASADVEEFEIASRGKSHGGAMFAGCPTPHSLLKSIGCWRKLICRVLPSHMNAVTVSCLETQLKWQLAGLLPINSALFLGYSRAGNARQVRRAAVDAIIILTGMTNRSISAYLVHLVLADADHLFRFHTLRSIVNFFNISLYGHKQALQQSGGRMWQLALQLFEMAMSLNPELEARKPIYQVPEPPTANPQPSIIAPAETPDVPSSHPPAAPVADSVVDASTAIVADAGPRPMDVDAPAAGAPQPRIVISIQPPPSTASPSLAIQPASAASIPPAPAPAASTAAAPLSAPAPAPISATVPDVPAPKRILLSFKPIDKSAPAPSPAPTATVTPSVVASGPPPPSQPSVPLEDGKAASEKPKQRPKIRLSASGPLLESGAITTQDAIATRVIDHDREAQALQPQPQAALPSQSSVQHDRHEQMEPKDKLPPKKRIPAAPSAASVPLPDATTQQATEAPASQAPCPTAMATLTEAATTVAAVAQSSAALNSAPRPTPKQHTTSTSVKEKPPAQQQQQIQPRDEARRLTDRQTAACRVALRQLSLHEAGIWFREPVDPVALNIPTYFDVIKRPMDFATIGSRLTENTYPSLTAFIDDVRLVFSNACTFNPPDSPVYTHARMLLAKFEKDLLPQLQAAANMQARGGGGSHGRLLLEAEPPERMILDELMIHKSAPIFLDPVSRTDYPDYYQKIAHPIALKTIDAKLRSNQYPTYEAFENDIRLLFRNCFEYNQKGTYGYEAGLQLKDASHPPTTFRSMDNKKRDIPPVKSGPRTIASLFTTWEIPQYPKSLPAAINRAERRETVRNQLHKLQQSKRGNASLPTGSAPGSAGNRQKYSRVLGQIGYEQLPLLPLRDIPEVELLKDRKLPNMNSANSGNSEDAGRSNTTSNLKDSIRSIVVSIEGLSWLSVEERLRMGNTFIADIASRYNHMDQLVLPRLLPSENRDLIAKIFNRIKIVTDGILERLRKKKEKMEKLGIFSQIANGDRLRTVFLTELHRKINSKDIMKRALHELRGGTTYTRISAVMKQDVALSELQEMKQTLDKITHPTPVLEIPVITMKGYNSRMGKSVEHHAQVTSSHEKNIASKQAERERLLTAVRSQHKLVSEDLIALLRKPQDPSDPIRHQVADEGELWEDVSENEFEDEACADLEYDDADVQVLAVHATDDPILQAHTEMSLFKRRSKLAPEPNAAPQRYLRDKFRHMRSPLMSMGFDMNALEDMQASLQKGKAPQPVVPFLSPNSNSVDKKDFISLAAEPTSGAGDFNSEVDNKVLNVLDEKLARYKEVEELYDEIMKTIPLTDSYLGIKSAFKARKKRTRQPQQAIGSERFSPTSPAMSQGRKTPIILMTTRHRGTALVPADEFIRDRAAAMKKIQSSKYNTLRYNFGGYIPLQTGEENRKPREEFGAADYAEHLKERTSDFLSNIIFLDHEDEGSSSDLEEQDSTLSAEERRKSKEEAAQKRKERLERLFSYKRDMWNAEILDYMSEISQGRQSTDDTASDTVDNPTPAPHGVHDAKDAAPATAKTGEEGKTGMRGSSPSRRSPSPKSPHRATRAVSPAGKSESLRKHSEALPATGLAGRAKETVAPAHKPTNETPLTFKASSIETHDVKSKEHDPQAELEALWVTLKMPLDQKLDMAINISTLLKRHQTCTVQAIKLWKTASEHITVREKILEELEAFEMTASNPSRFFSKGYVGSSAARLKEAEEREELMRRLHSVEARINSIASHIKYELRETVTYDGAPYIEKMKTDYTDILRKCSKARMDTQL
ncbi:hypothetical protein BC831DRAFT_433969 [Entophlyctis helioformis]|nr:hypothetical protein BC831DRAFT_433969 [Entophlyctis helioformis]